MGRGKDKRTEKRLKEFHKQLKEFDDNEQLAFVNINNIQTNLLISSKGILYRIDPEERTITIVHPYMEKDGHLRYGTTYKGKKIKMFIHKLVALYFVPNPDNKPEVHHKDGDELNNDKKNLMWVTHKEHVKLTKELGQYKGVIGSFNSSSLYTDEQIHHACKLIEENELYPEKICELSGISYSTFQHILHRKKSWDYIKKNYNISNYNKYKRNFYTEEQKEKFKILRKENPELSLRKISEILDVRYAAIKNWNRKLIKINA